MKTYRQKYTITIGDFIVINSNIPVIKKEEPENIVLTLNTALDLKNYLDILNKKLRRITFLIVINITIR